MSLEKILPGLITLLVVSSQLHSQCSNTNQFPSFTEQVPYFQLEQPIASQIYAGEYTLATGWNAFENYVVASSQPDYISIYSLDDQLVAHGPSPLTFSTDNIFSSDSLKINFNLISPPCGTEDVSRQPTIECLTCPPPSNVGIGNSNPHQSAILDLTNSRSQGLLLPSVLGLPNAPVPQDGLLIYDNAADELKLHKDQAWTTVATTSDIADQLSSPRQLTIPSAAFLPMSSSTEHGFSNTRGKYSDGFSLIAPIILPTGATINSVRYYFYDNNSTDDANISLRYNSATSGTTTSIAIYDTSGAFNSIRSGLFTSIDLQVAANTNYYLVFNPENTVLTSNLAIKSVTVWYTPQ